MSTWAIMPLYYYNDVYMQSEDVDNIYANLYGYKYFGFATAPGNTLSLQIASEPDKLDPALNSTVDGACLAILAFSVCSPMMRTDSWFLIWLKAMKRVTMR